MLEQANNAGIHSLSLQPVTYPSVQHQPLHPPDLATHLDTHNRLHRRRHLRPLIPEVQVTLRSRAPN